MLHLLRVQRSRHIQILLLGLGNWIGRVVRTMSCIIHHSFVRRVFLVISAEPHFPLEVDFSLLVAFLSIPQLLVSSVDQVVTSSDVVVPVVLDALLSVLAIKVEFVDDLVEQFILDRHLFLAWEQAHIPISILDLQRPGVVPDVLHAIPLLWIGIQDPPDQVFAL